MAKKLVELQIGGQKYRIASAYDAAYMSELAEYLNKKLAAMQKAAKSRSTQQQMILVCLDLVDELFSAKNDGEQTKARLKKEITDTIAEVDRKIEFLRSNIS